LWENSRVRAALELGSQIIATPSGIVINTHKFLYESIPDIFPHKFLTNVEMALWQKFKKNCMSKK